MPAFDRPERGLRVGDHLTHASSIGFRQIASLNELLESSDYRFELRNCCQRL
jgi:hypothetical protein